MGICNYRLMPKFDWEPLGPTPHSSSGLPAKADFNDYFYFLLTISSNLSSQSTHDHSSIQYVHPTIHPLQSYNTNHKSTVCSNHDIDTIHVQIGPRQQNENITTIITLELDPTFIGECTFVQHNSLLNINNDCLI